MDSTQIEALITALAQSPDNLTLRMLVVKSLHEAGNVSKAAEFANELSPDRMPQPEDRLVAAGVFLADADPSRALEFLTNEGPKELLLKAKALHSLGDTRQARNCYQQAVRENSALEDPALAALLSAVCIEPKQDGRPRLRVIANDDTDKTEIRRFTRPPEETVTFSQVGGLDEVKRQIHRKIILPFQKPSLFQKFRKRVGGGILLYGPPGCGKTLLARATAGECRAQFYNVVISDILDMYIGESESKLHAVFEQARQNTPAVIFFDEVEALAAKRQHTREATSSKLVSQFLSELDGFSQDNAGVLILAATNVPWVLDPAFRRPGRFDRVIFVAPPDKEARQAILDGLLAERPGGDTVNTRSLAARTGGFSGADLKNLIETAVDEAIEDSIDRGAEIPLCQKHIDTAFGQIRPTTLEWLTTARNYAKYANEAGQYNDVLNFIDKYGK